MQFRKIGMCEVMTDKAMESGIQDMDGEGALKGEIWINNHDTNEFMDGFCVTTNVMMFITKRHE